MSDELLAERDAILRDLASIEVSIAELAEVLGTNMDHDLARRLAERFTSTRLRSAAS